MTGNGDLESSPPQTFKRCWLDACLNQMSAIRTNTEPYLDYNTFEKNDTGHLIDSNALRI